MPSSPLVRLVWHVLQKCQSTLESNHALIDGDVFAESVIDFELLEDDIKDGSDLVELVVAWLCSSWLLSGVVEVKEF